ncbi:pacifastin-like protease inhibitor cvp4 [Maniola hyperantus]|uniref:pacifastin-like protease inhibitor cvp4 n=1 Tax=Aphantopus hyperantus TaxID=2795564 RepID=UPI00374A65AA
MVKGSTKNKPSDTIENQIFSTHGRRVIRRAAICKPNAAFKVYCNDCECASDGQSYTCTNYECMERDVNDDVEVFMESEGADHIERHSVCKPRGTFYIGCNTCHCSADGMDFSCTNKPCPLPKDVEIFHEFRDLQPIVP